MGVSPCSVLSRGKGTLSAWRSTLDRTRGTSFPLPSGEDLAGQNLDRTRGYPSSPIIPQLLYFSEMINVKQVYPLYLPDPFGKDVKCITAHSDSVDGDVTEYSVFFTPEVHGEKSFNIKTKELPFLGIGTGPLRLKVFIEWAVPRFLFLLVD